MSVGIYRAAVAMVGQERRLDSIAANLANLETAGYKRTATSAREFSVDGPRADADGVRGLTLDATVDFSQGDLRRTGHEYDFALQGDGFFSVEGPAG